MTDNLAELFALSREARGRNRIDRCRDFRAVFMGSEAGKRVLEDLLCICRFHERTAVKGDSHETYYREGQRSIALAILLTVLEEPAPAPTHQSTTEPPDA